MANLRDRCNDLRLTVSLLIMPREYRNGLAKFYAIDDAFTKLSNAWMYLFKQGKEDADTIDAMRIINKLEREVIRG